MSRVVVVGAGVGGLAVAARLAEAGHAVTVLEAAPEVGGKLGLHAEAGFRFDTGPSVVTLPDVVRRLLARTGARPDDVLPLRRLDPAARYRFAEGPYGDAVWWDVPADPAALGPSLDGALGAGAGRQWTSLLARGGRVWEATEHAVLGTELRGVPTLAALAARRPSDVALVAPHRTLRGLGLRSFTDPRLVALLDRYATYSGSDPRRAPAALAAVPAVEHDGGAWYVDGGLRRLAEVLAERCAGLGASVRTGMPVASVDVADGRVAGVTTQGGEHLPAEVVVSGVDAQHLYGALLPAGGGARPAARALRRLRRATPSLSGFVVLLGVRGTTPELAHHTVLFPRRYDDEFDAVFGSPAQPVPDPTLYVSRPVDPTVAPPGHEAWFLLVNAPRHAPGRPGRGTVDWDAPGLADSYADRLLALLAGRGVEVRDRVVLRHVITPADLERRTGSPGGAIYGTSSNGPRAAFLRPANRGPVDGLFLVGGSAHPGGGLPIVLLGAEVVARAVGPA